MADPMEAVVAAAADALAAAVDANEPEVNNSNGLKKRAFDMLTDAANEDDEVKEDDLELGATTLDDVMVSPELKKARVVPPEEEVPGDDDAADVAIGEDDQDVANAFATEGDVDVDELDDMELAPPDASTDEDESPRNSHANGNGNGSAADADTDVVDLDGEDVDDEDEEDDDVDVSVEEFDEEEDEEEDDDQDEVISPEQRRKMDQNKVEARHLMAQLSSSQRSKLVLSAMEKYGEELFDGHEAARDAILVDACAHETILGLMKETVRMSELYLRGTEDAPLEVDDDEEDYGDEDDEDDDEDDEDDEPKIQQQHVDGGDHDDEEEEEDDDGEINLLSDEETDDNAAPRRTEEAHDDDDDDEDDDNQSEEDTAGTAEEDHAATGEEDGEDDSLGELSS